MSEGGFLFLTDAVSQKYGDQRGLDTLVVHTLTDECYMLPD